MRRFNPLMVSLVAVVTLSLGACASQSDRKQATEQKARDMSSDVWATNNQIDATMLSLNNLMSAQGTQLQQAFDQYSTNVDRLHNQSERINNDGAYIRKQSDAYLNAWQKQDKDIQNPDLRDNSEQGRQDVRNRFQRAQASNENARLSLERLIRKLEDVRTTLRNDLSERGVSGVAQTNVVQSAQSNAEEAKTNLQQAQADSTLLAKAISPAARPLASSDGASDGTAENPGGNYK
jgi:hypothetical protein